MNPEFLLNFETILWNIALALLISGALLVILSFVLNIENITEAFGGHDVSHDIGDHDIGGHDISHDVGDHDIGGHDVSHDIGDHDVGDHEVSSESGDVSDLTPHKVSKAVVESIDITRSSAPLFLLMSTYFLIFGILGVSTLRISSDDLSLRIVRIVSVFVVPYFLAWILSKTWRKLSATTSIIVPKGEQLVGEIGEVFVSVDVKGGIIVVDLGQNIGLTKLHAKTFSPFDKFKKGEKVRIVAFKNNTYLVDSL
ncbi:MAG: hypothetical protein K9W45_13255 [Candidatus Heimdallarchaeum aukensis]|uniref:NfeD-like C-terminal domain-containing protein n=1 Tax=Candidatus Heimdallarchaeum aukensis TaxID=2876573 RepID=A0A9Y1BL90_9ARCH|nr:MAG: hypothetical protein K9W45_13255 [Candidatus Heimdallarchaeum aukensis]